MYKVSTVLVKHYHISKSRSALISGHSEFVITKISRRPNKVWLMMELVDYYGHQLFCNLLLYLLADKWSVDSINQKLFKLAQFCHVKIVQILFKALLHIYFKILFCMFFFSVSDFRTILLLHKMLMTVQISYMDIYLIMHLVARVIIHSPSVYVCDSINSLTLPVLVSD
jgi:hypothetical protein